MEAESRHQRAALLSNQLHTIADEDTVSALKLMAEIEVERNAWRELRKKVKAFDDTGIWPIEKQKSADTAGMAEIQVQLMRLRTNIWKKEKNISENPEHPKRLQWEEELAKLLLQKANLEKELTLLKYA